MSGLRIFALSLGAIALPLVAAQAAPRDCVTGAQACPAVVHMTKGAISARIAGSLTENRPRYFASFEARAGQMLTLESVKDPGIKWGAGVPIAFPDGSGSDAVDLGQSFKLPRSGVYVIEIIANTMADDVYGPFVVKLTIR